MRKHVIVCLLVACSGSDEREVAETRGARGNVGAEPAAISAAERRANDPFHNSRPSSRFANDPNAPRQVTTVMQSDTPGMEQTERNYAGELQAAAGSPMGCGDMGGLTGEIVIPLSATVSQQGRVTRASVGGSLPAETRDCMRRRIEAQRFAPIENGPRTISASLTVNGTPGETMMNEAPMTGFALQQGQQGIAGPSGTGISATMGTPIGSYGTMQGGGGVTIMGPSGSTITQMTTGVTIMGPTGMSITE